MKKLLLLIIALGMTCYQHAAKPGEPCEKNSDCVGGLRMCVNKESKGGVLDKYFTIKKRCI